MFTNQKYQINESAMKNMNSQTLRELRDIAKMHNTRCYYKLKKADLLASLLEHLTQQKQSEQSTLETPTHPPNNQKV